ncbi:Uncharacterised protein [Niallia circulans]|jgi:hypothetical protein|nr:hypothetical protein DB29_01992 [Shouchella clausii]GIN09893.1 hypothetical protein J1TS1_40380 [Shouchella clausii]GIN14461.1 hypothetical protein J26TS2_43280 [Shouchella clausii]GIN17985.1 hypothetical protein J32TS2_33410 [Shouchella clausii]SPU18495.1 Uncharacterised protein [Niallia circulans]
MDLFNGSQAKFRAYLWICQAIFSAVVAKLDQSVLFYATA